MLKLACLSDLHLGEGESIINTAHPEGVEQLVARLKRMCGDDTTIEHLVLLGDTLDYSEADETEVQDQFKAFWACFAAAFAVKTVHWVIGNHDHHLLDLICGGDNTAILSHLRQAANKHGVLPVPLDTGSSGSQLFQGLLGGHAATLRYPNYEYEDTANKRLFFFTHGDLFSESVLKLGRIRHPIHPPSAASNVADLVESTWDLVKFVWWDSKFKGREQLYEILRSNEHDLFKTKGEARLKRYLLDVCDYRKRWEKAGKPELYVIFGHTHDAFFRFIETEPKDKIETIRTYNTGGWIVTGMNHHPHTMIFAIDSQGSCHMENLFADVPYEKSFWNVAWKDRS